MRPMMVTSRESDRSLDCVERSVPMFLPEILPVVKVGRRLDRVVYIPPDERRGEHEALLYRLTQDHWEATS